MKIKDGWYAKDSNQDVFWYAEMPEKGKDCWNYGTPSRLLHCIQIDDPWGGGLTPQGRGWCDYKSTNI